MTWLEALAPGQRLIVAAILLTVLVVVAILTVRIVDRAIDLVVDAWGGLEARRDARRRNPRKWAR